MVFKWNIKLPTNSLQARPKRKKVTFSSEKSKYWFLSANHRPIEKFDLVVQAVSLLQPVNANLHTFYKLLPGPSYTGERSRGPTTLKLNFNIICKVSELKDKSDIKFSKHVKDSSYGTFWQFKALQNNLKRQFWV